MSAWADLNTAIGTALTGAGYVLPREQDPERWPSWAIGSSGAARWVAVDLQPAAGAIQGGGDTIRHELTVRAICGGPWSASTSQAAALDFARACRAALETTAGFVSGSAHAVYQSVSVTRLGACYLVSVSFNVIQFDTY
jgi:hypothetical protein